MALFEIETARSHTSAKRITGPETIQVKNESASGGGYQSLGPTYHSCTFIFEEVLCQCPLYRRRLLSYPLSPKKGVGKEDTGALGPFYGLYTSRLLPQQAALPPLVPPILGGNRSSKSPSIGGFRGLNRRKQLVGNLCIHGSYAPWSTQC
jgi:hypothetical protein